MSPISTCRYGMPPARGGGVTPLPPLAGGIAVWEERNLTFRERRCYSVRTMIKKDVRPLPRAGAARILSARKDGTGSDDDVII